MRIQACAFVCARLYRLYSRAWYVHSARAVEQGDVAMMQFLTLNGVTCDSADISYAEEKWGSGSDILTLLMDIRTDR